LFLGNSLWPYFAGAVVLVIGLANILRPREREKRSGIEWALLFGPVFLASPMAVFGADHFVFPTVVAPMVPSWIPGHLFWVYFVGTALIAAALSIVTGPLAVLAATLLSAMIFSFDLLIHIPNFVANHGDRFTSVIVLREMSFSVGALAYAAAGAKKWPTSHVTGIVVLIRYVFAIAAVVFGVEHFLHPEFVPVIPLNKALPAWVPAHLLLNYLTGAVLVASGLALLLNRKPRMAAASLGVFVFVVTSLVYLPIMIANISTIGNGLNFLADTLAYGGAALLVARALPGESHAEAVVSTLKESLVGAGVSHPSDA
jgi:uncharacterized membrane protein